MRLHLSHPVPAGHVILGRIPDNSQVLADFIDEDTPRDLTDLACDLLLIGMAVFYDRQAGLEAGSTDELNIADVSAQGDTPTFTYLHPGEQVASDIDPAQALEFISLGIASQITSGVAHEAAEEATPDTPDDLDH